MIHQIKINLEDFLDRADFENSIPVRTCYCVKRTYIFNEQYSPAIKDMKVFFHDQQHMPKELYMGPLYITNISSILNNQLTLYIKKLQYDYKTRNRHGWRSWFF